MIFVPPPDSALHADFTQWLQQQGSFGWLPLHNNNYIAERVKNAAFINTACDKNIYPKIMPNFKL